jgi:molybdopterin molybdotransferase
MIDFEEALELVIREAPGPGEASRCPLAAACGRVLAADVISDVDLPPFDKSGMDGFAVRLADLATVPATLDVIMDLPAGASPTGGIGPGQCAAVMTGAPVPAGTDAVVQVEWTSGFGERTVVVRRAVARGANLSPRGEMVRAGDTVLRAGTAVDVEEIGLLAAVGRDPVPVFPLPTVAILSTGDEVVPPSCTPGPSQIRDVNGPALAAFVRGMGLAPVALGTVRDDPASLAAAVEEGLSHDCLLMSGGVSAGAYDFAGDVLARLGVAVHFSRVAVKPGKPTVFGTRGDRMVFGLPGNPVSAMVIARLLVAPALRKRMGASTLAPRRMTARLSEDIRKKTDRAWFVHGVLEPGATLGVRPILGRGSADLPAAARADCLVFAPREAGHLRAGDPVEVVVWSRSL